MPDVRPVEKLKSISCELQAKSADKRLIKIFIGEIWLLPWPGERGVPARHPNDGTRSRPVHRKSLSVLANSY
jgi:hypothetical protein